MPKNQQNERAQISTQMLQSELGGRLFKTTSLTFEIGKYIIAIITVILTIHSLFATIQIISGPSMLPTFTSGSHVFVDRRDWIELKRGEVVILKYPGDPQHRSFIKRIIGVPGDTVAIRDSVVYVNNSPINESYLQLGTITAPNIDSKVLGKDEYFTMGDNRPVSNDSRFFGPVERKFIIGRVITTLFAAPEK